MQSVSGTEEGQPLLQVRQLSQHRSGLSILQGVSFSLSEGEVLVLIGPSGGGKSSLLRLLNRLDEPHEGEILLRGESIRDLPPVLLRQRVGMLLQQPFMFEGTVLDNLQAAFRLRELTLPNEQSGKIQNVVSWCGLEQALLKRDASQLSVGQQQRVCLGRALLTGPEVLLLDEPTSALDRPSADRLGELLQRLCREQGLAMLLVTHDLRLAERIADRILFLVEGRIAEEGGVDILRRAKSRQLQNFLREPQAGRERREE
jgi:putative ABC transport system ATP-binding protein